MSAYDGLIAALGAVPGLTVIGYPPAALNTTQMPCALVSPGPATHTWQALDYRRTEREWHIYALAGPVGQGTLEKANQTLRKLVADIVDALLDNPTLGGHADHIARITDDGLGVHQIAGTDYIGALVRVDVIEKWA